MTTNGKCIRKIVMTVFCLAEDAEDVKASLFCEDGDCWFYNNDAPLGNITVEILEPTDEEEAKAREALDVEDVEAAGQDEPPTI